MNTTSSVDSFEGPKLFRFKGLAVSDAPDVDAFVTVGERFVAVGTHLELSRRFPEAEQVDLGDSYVLPGFNDAHMHPSMAADYGLVANLAPPAVDSMDRLLESLRTYADSTSDDEWIRAARYDHGKTTEGSFIGRQELDEAFPNRPVCIRHISGHFTVLNSRGLERVGITSDTPDPVGGEIRRDAGGEPTGVLVGRAQQSVRDVVPPLEIERRLEGLRSLAAELHAAGITSVTDALVTPHEIDLFQAAREVGAFPLRVNLLVWWQSADLANGLRLRSGFGDEWLRLGGIKATWDGAVAGATCFVDEPFEGTDDRGLLLMSRTEIEDLVQDVDAAGSRLAIHANGDAAISSLLDVLERVRQQNGPARVRHRIEHASLITDSILERAARLNLILVPLFSYVSFHGQKILEYFGEHRLDRTVACRSMLDAGITVAGSSDFGAGPYPPMANIQAVVTRRDADGRDLGNSQAITTEEAIRAYTVGAAEASGESQYKGQIAPGFLADFITFSEDPGQVPPHELAELAVTSTWIGSECVYEAP